MAAPRHGNALTATLAGLADRFGGRSAGADALADVGDLSGRHALVTGATSGLGRAVAVELARRGARVLVACRSRLDTIASELSEASGGGTVEVLAVDLADLDSVGALADALAERGERLDVAVLNAGLMPRRAYPTAQGFEVMFGVNFLANVLLTRRMLAAGTLANGIFATATGASDAGPRTRIVMVSSEVHRSAAPLDFDRFGAYVDYGMADGMKQYGHSKLAICTYATELARRLAPDGEVDVAVHSLCPGPVRSRMARDAPVWVKPLLGPVMRAFFLPPERAAVPVIHLAASRALEGATGRYFHMTTEKRPSDQALDPERGRRLWEACERLLDGRL